MTDTEIDTWSIVDTYFRDSPYYKSQHQLDSYDEFIYTYQWNSTYSSTM